MFVAENAQENMRFLSTNHHDTSIIQEKCKKLKMNKTSNQNEGSHNGEHRMALGGHASHPQASCTAHPQARRWQRSPPQSIWGWRAATPRPRGGPQAAPTSLLGGWDGSLIFLKKYNNNKHDNQVWLFFSFFFSFLFLLCAKLGVNL
jgi:hypothetical protein